MEIGALRMDERLGDPHLVLRDCQASLETRQKVDIRAWFPEVGEGRQKRRGPHTPFSCGSLGPSTDRSARVGCGGASPRFSSPLGRRGPSTTRPRGPLCSWGKNKGALAALKFQPR